MKLNKWQSNHGEEMELVCSPEELEMLREFLAAQGVLLYTSVYSRSECKTYVRNPYREAVQGWGSDLCRKMAEDFYQRGMRGR